MPAEDFVRFECPHCGRQLAAPSGGLLKEISCPICGKQLIVPAGRRDEPAGGNATEADGFLRQVRRQCETCGKTQTGFVVPDGRWICPECSPPAVYARWENEWRPIEKAKQKEAQRLKKEAQRLKREKARRLKQEYERKRQEKILEETESKEEHCRQCEAPKSQSKLNVNLFEIPQQIKGVLAILIIIVGIAIGAGIGAIQKAHLDARMKEAKVLGWVWDYPRYSSACVVGDYIRASEWAKILKFNIKEAKREVNAARSFTERIADVFFPGAKAEAFVEVLARRIGRLRALEMLTGRFDSFSDYYSRLKKH